MPAEHARVGADLAVGAHTVVDQWCRWWWRPTLIVAIFPSGGPASGGNTSYDT